MEVLFDLTSHEAPTPGDTKSQRLLSCEICHQEVDSRDIRWHQSCPGCKQKALSGQEILVGPRIDTCGLCGAEEDIHTVDYGSCGLEVECRSSAKCRNRQNELGRAHHCMLCKAVYYGKDDGGLWLQRCKDCEINCRKE